MGGLAALGGAENACAAAATRPKFIGGAAAVSLSTAVDDDDLDVGMGGGDVVDEATTALPARWKPAARARWLAGFVSARWAAGFARARWAAVKAAAAGIGDCISKALSEVEVLGPPTRARRSGLEVKYSSRRAKNASFSCAGSLANGIYR